MRRPSQFTNRRPLRFNITPLIDVVFLLIIFFLVASHFVRSENAKPVDLPVASDAIADEQPTHRLTVTILQDGSLFINGKPVSEDEVHQRITTLAQAATADQSQPELRIRADRAGRWGAVSRLRDECARHNFTAIQIAVAKEAP